ncbi:hypothetical protein O9G_002433 [Rozella allomycis CSF55]|uniref:Uncharacterized protein n=1 Tax=Rozella allomycis (strain CSF55) TaxID=988480 RepID=A0A075AWX4_ROZAC|nr:hypothetical protein O9G_002433 [Rozella allomycis CSF55]|eukprot:EPZ34835.1 hypothetical protein O9G_002433 [Rozella allomycis CSF55]
MPLSCQLVDDACCKLCFMDCILVFMTSKGFVPAEAIPHDMHPADSSLRRINLEVESLLSIDTCMDKNVGK